MKDSGQNKNKGRNKEFGNAEELIRYLISDRALLLVIGLVFLAGIFAFSNTQAQETYAYYFPIARQNFQLTGEVTGTVYNAADGVTPIPNAQICITETNDCVVADGLGVFSFQGIPVGNASLTASSFGFFDQEESVEVENTQTSTLDFFMVPSTTEGVVHVELTWDSQRDLDTHLWLPPTTPVHLYWRFLGDCGFFPFACLDKDDFASGPETIRIRQLLPGNYVYAVFLFDPGNIVNSSPQVRVTDANGLVAEFSVPEDGQGRWWYVFDLDGFSGNITLVNQVTSDNPAPYDPSTGIGDETFTNQSLNKR